MFTYVHAFLKFLPVVSVFSIMYFIGGTFICLANLIFNWNNLKTFVSLFSGFFFFQDLHF